MTPDAGGIGAVAELGPRAILLTVLVRLAGLPDGAGALARAIAVLGDAAELPLAAELAALSPEASSVAASALIRAEILVDGPGMRFVHPLIGSAVYEEIPVPDRADAHEGAAVAVRRHGQPVGAIAAHLALANPGRQDWAYDVLIDAARASLRAGAPADAVAYLRRAFAEPAAADHRAELVLMLARATMLVDGPAAEGHMRDALELADGPEARGTIALELARLLMFMGRAREGVPLAQRAAAELPEEAGDLRRMLATASLMAPLFDPEFAPPADLVQRGRELPLEPGLGAKMVAAQSARNWAYEGGSAQRCAALALASLQDGDLVRADSVFLSVSAVMVLELADRPEADAGWAALMRERDLRGSHHTRIAVNLFRGYALARRGELAAADVALVEALEAVRDWNGVQGGVHAAAFRSLAHRERGDLVGARAALEAVPRPDDASDEARLWVDSELAQLNAEGRHDEALAGAADAERRFALVLQPIDSPPLQHRAVALDGLGRRDEALVAALEGLAQAQVWGAPGTMARALRTLGLIERGAEGLEHLRAAVDVTTGSRARLELAKSQVELGVALQTAGSGQEARPVLRAGLELAAVLGAAVLADRARRALHAAGGRPRTIALTGPGALTAAERRVAEHAAAGATNREIAGTLFVAQKTVELHLSNTYRKLGIAGRRELAAALAET